ncbi:MAG TPA: TonB-dependent receptor [Pirellulales bacterium]
MRRSLGKSERWSRLCGLLLAWQVISLAQPAWADEPAAALPEIKVVAVQPAVTPIPRVAFQPPPLPTNPPAPELPPVNVVAEPQAAPSVGPTDEVTGPSILNGTIFTSPAVNGYNAPTSTVGTLIDAPNMLFPGTISTITRDVIKDQQVLMMDDLIRDIPSAVKSYGVDGVIRPDQFFVRGFEVTSRSWRKDGLLDPTYMPRDPVNIERIDVLSGPSSVLYGAAQPTGTFNVTTKRAQADQFATGGVMTGSYGLQRYTMDVNSWLDADKTWLFRLNGAYQYSNSFRTDVFTEREILAPTLTKVLDDDTQLIWSGEYQHDRFRMDQGIPAINGDPFAVSNNVFTGNPSGDIADYHSYRSTLTFERILNDDWTMRVAEMSLWYNTPSTTTFLDNGTTSAAGLLSSPIIPQDQTVANPFMEQNHDIMETVAGEFDTGGFKHKAVFGAEQDWFITNHDTFTTSSITTPAFGTVSAFGPVNALGASSFPLVPSTMAPAGSALTSNVFDNPSFRQNRFGFFAQDMIDVTDRLHLTLGGRYDYTTQEYARSDTTTLLQPLASVPPLPAGTEIFSVSNFRTNDTFNQFSPRAGITYDLVPERMSAYAMYSRSFTPSIGVSNFSGTAPLLPEIGNIWEGGIKTKLSDKYMLTTSGYWIKEYNVNVEQFNPTPGAALPFFLTQAGMQRSQGVEANVTGSLTDRLTTISNFGYNDSYIYGVAQPTSDAAPLAVSRVRGIPHWLGNVWLRYNFVQDKQRTIGTAVGMRYVGSRVGDYASPLILPSYDIWDLGFYYNQGRWNASLLWDNIFNETYAATSLSQYQVIPGTPSNVRLMFSGTF